MLHNGASQSEVDASSKAALSLTSVLHGVSQALSCPQSGDPSGKLCRAVDGKVERPELQLQ